MKTLVGTLVCTGCSVRAVWLGNVFCISLYIKRAFGAPGLNGRSMNGKRWMVWMLAVAVCASACDKKKEIFDEQMDTIRSWVETSNNNDSAYTEIASGVFRDIVYPEDGRGTVIAEKGDSLYVMYELYEFTTSFSATSKGTPIYTNKADLMPERVEWSRDTLRMKLGGGTLMKGVEESLTGSAPGDLVLVVLTSSNAYGDHTVQQLPPNTPVAWRIDVEKVIKNE